MKVCFSIIVLSLFAMVAAVTAKTQPNIVLVITDDQGYGDLGHTGNPIIKTPHIDSLAAESSSLTDFHVAPTCSPTRGSLLTGHWTNRTGVWHTVNGRSMLRENEVTLARMLQDGGYATGMFGKWHLGDNYPYRAEDRGFTEVFRHGGGGVGQTPDVWDNAYFDGSYFHNSEIVEAKGFCTDVFFERGNRFIREQVENEKPFFAYIALNAPHGPLLAPQYYLDMYRDQPGGIAAFYGMITNIDDNVGRTRALLKELGVYENTIFIFMTDNGSAYGSQVYNASMKGKKGSAYDGGHRVPFIMHWPEAGLNKEHESDTLSHAVDIVPTLLDLAGVKKPRSVKFDGKSIRSLLDPSADEDWPDRFLITDSQRVRDPIKWRQSSVMSQEWRLINGEELYQIKKDPGQANDVSSAHPEQVEEMRAFYDEWWTELEPTFAETTEIYIGHEKAPVVTLTAHDWIQELIPPWNQSHIRRAAATKAKRGSGSNALSHDGHWAIKVIKGGLYEISLRRWPVEAGLPIRASLEAGADVPGSGKPYRATDGIAIPAQEAVLRINGKSVARQAVGAEDVSINFEAELSKGSHELSPVFLTENGDEYGAYYAIVRKAD